MPWRRKWQPTPVLLPGEFHGWRNLVGSSPWDRKESDTTVWLTLTLTLWLLCCWHLFKLWYGCSVSTGSDYTVVELENYPCHAFIFPDHLQEAGLLLLCVHAQMLSCVPLFVTPWTVALHVPLFMEFSRQKYWSGLPFPPPRDLPNPSIEPRASCKAGRFFTIWAIKEALLLLL